MNHHERQFHTILSKSMTSLWGGWVFFLRGGGVICLFCFFQHWDKLIQPIFESWSNSDWKRQFHSDSTIAQPTDLRTSPCFVSHTLNLIPFNTICKQIPLRKCGYGFERSCAEIKEGICPFMNFSHLQSWRCYLLFKCAKILAKIKLFPLLREINCRNIYFAKIAYK